MSLRKSIVVLLALSLLAGSGAAAVAQAPGNATITYAKNEFDEWNLARLGALKTTRGVIRLDAARAAFGPPSSVKFEQGDDGSNADADRCTVRWPRLGLVAYFFPDRPRRRERCPGPAQLGGFRVSKPAFRTVGGIRVGSTAADVRRAHAGAWKARKGKEVELYGAELTIVLTGGRVTEIYGSFGQT